MATAPAKSADPSCSAPELPARVRYPKLAALIEYLEKAEGRIDLDTLAGHLKDLNVTRNDFSDCCIFGTRGYRRNTISRNDHYELLALCWRSGDCTAIHDHKGHSCAFRVIEGTGTEIRFKVTASNLICPVETNSMPPGYICAALDADIHQVANMQPEGTDLITLHIYSPPIKKMNTYQFAQAVNSPYEAEWVI